MSFFSMREKARSRRSAYEVSRKPRIARVSLDPMPVSVAPKKNDTGASRASATRTRRPAPTRLTPFSYFCTCWNVTPRRFPKSVCDMPLAMRRARMRWPTSTSSDVVPLTLDFATMSAPIRSAGDLPGDGSEFQGLCLGLPTVKSDLRTVGCAVSFGVSAREARQSAGMRLARRAEDRKVEELFGFGRGQHADQVARVDEFIAKKRVALGIEKGAQPIDEYGDARNAACVGMIRHPDIDLMPD